MSLRPKTTDADSFDAFGERSDAPAPTGSGRNHRRVAATVFWSLAAAIVTGRLLAGPPDFAAVLASLASLAGPG